jgi:hypothetical protein
MQSDQNRTSFITSVTSALARVYNSSNSAFVDVGVYPGSIKVNFTVVDEDIAKSIQQDPLPDSFTLEYNNMSIYLVNGSFKFHYSASSLPAATTSTTTTETVDDAAPTGMRTFYHFLSCFNRTRCVEPLSTEGVVVVAVVAAVIVVLVVVVGIVFKQRRKRRTLFTPPPRMSIVIRIPLTAW